MYFSNYLSPYVNLITVLLFAIPLLWIFIRRKTFKPFTFQKLTTAFNWTLLYYAIFSIILLATMKIVDTTVYGNANSSQGNDISEITIGAAYSYVVIGAFFYLPSIGLINLINWVIRKSNKQGVRTRR